MPTLRQLWELSLYQRSILVILLICNVLGTIYGFIWYGDRLLKDTMALSNFCTR